MYRLGAIILLSTVMTACAAGPNLGAPDLAFGGFDYEPSDGAREAGARFGYDLRGDDGWEGDLSFGSGPGGPIVSFAYASRRADDADGELRISMPYLEGGVRRYEGLSSDGREIAVRLQAGPCMQGTEMFTHFAAIRVGSTAVTGCARERAAQDRWSNYLMAYMPAIDLCLDEMGDEARHVSLVYAMPGEMTGVRVVDQAQRTWECAIRDESGAINSIRTLDAADTRLGEGDPVFVRGEVPDMGAGCYVYETVRHADGRLIGAFGYDACDASVTAQSPSALTRS